MHERGSDEAGGGSTRTHDVHRRWGSVFWRSWGRASSAAACPSLGGRTPTSFTTARRPRTPARGREAGCWRGRGVAARRAGRQAGATRLALSAGVPPRLNSAAAHPRDAASHMSLIEGIMATSLEVLKGLNDLGLAGRVGYVCGLGVWTLLCLPTTPVELAAGLSFPLLSCCAMSAAGKTVGSLAALLLGRRLLRPFIARYLADRGGGGALHSSVVKAGLSVGPQLGSLASSDGSAGPWAALRKPEPLRSPRGAAAPPCMPTLAFSHAPHTQAPPPASRAARTPDPDDEPAARRAAAHPSQDLRPLALPCRAHPALILRRHRHHLQPAARPAGPKRPGGSRAGPPYGSRRPLHLRTARQPSGPSGSRVAPPPQCRPVACASRRQGRRCGSHGILVPTVCDPGGRWCGHSRAPQPAAWPTQRTPARP